MQPYSTRSQNLETEELEEYEVVEQDNRSIEFEVSKILALPSDNEKRTEAIVSSEEKTSDFSDNGDAISECSGSRSILFQEQQFVSCPKKSKVETEEVVEPAQGYEPPARQKRNFLAIPREMRCSTES